MFQIKYFPLLIYNMSQKSNLLLDSIIFFNPDPNQVFEKFSSNLFIIQMFDGRFIRFLNNYSKIIGRFAKLNYTHLFYRSRYDLDPSSLNLSYDEGGHNVPPQSAFIFLPKISPPDQTLTPTCKFLILGLLYHEFFFFWKFSI